MRFDSMHIITKCGDIVCSIFYEQLIRIVYTYIYIIKTMKASIHSMHSNRCNTELLAS